MQVRRQIKSATFASYIPANDERQMQLRKNQSDDKAQSQVTLHYLANKYVLKKGTVGTYAWRHPNRIRQSAKSKRSSIRGKIYRMDFAH